MIFDIYYLLDAISVTFQLPTDATNVARAGRAGRAGTRVGRLLKIVRMIRVFRIAKLYKETRKAIDEQRKIIRRRTDNKRGSKCESDSMSNDGSLRSDFFRPRNKRLLRATTFNDAKRPNLMRKKARTDSMLPKVPSKPIINEPNLGKSIAKLQNNYMSRNIDESDINITNNLHNVSNITDFAINTNNDI